ncbi:MULTISPECIES: DEAD/DEAH box helicase [Streptomyces]|uniref:DEAD/DEAH box helicase n=1 Tax=Streptomyces TaxID=1883 RepID=UPI0006994BFF|nr:DEAD/DEAH box helicase [Streptomyces sp. SID7805]MYU55020.1 DEAD/DEAH box helicase [Streptomyces sp. SID7805]
MASDRAERPDPVDRLHPVLLHHVVNTLGWPDLRPLQKAAIDPLMDGEDAVLLAPTAGGKTEAASFPLLAAMENSDWQGTSVLYLAPLKALLNNLEPRLETYAGWLGRTAGLWHGDTRESARKRMRVEGPDILLTTPESLEAQLISEKTDHKHMLGGVRAVVVDEVHAFASDDRGWHLLAVLERLERLASRRIQRIGLSATVGNPEDLLHWLQGARPHERAGRVVAPGVQLTAPEGSPPPPGDIELDYVGSLDNAAKLISLLHGGEKRLVFCDSRAQVEELGEKLRIRGVTTYLSHSSLSLDERRRSEEAFAEARGCVIVSTSTLELGIDVGDLDRVIQIGAPDTVAAFLQRLGRTGRRAGTIRNALFLATEEPTLLKAAALLLLWGRHWVEPVVPPPQPRHLVAQQILAAALQQHTLGDRTWCEEWNGLAPFDKSATPIMKYLIGEGFLESDEGLLFIGPHAEKHFGRRHFMALTAAFTAPPQFTVYFGRKDLGTIDPQLLLEQREGPRLLLLGGRSWQVGHIDFGRRRTFVEPADGGGRARWDSYGLSGLSFPLTRAMRDVLLGADPPARLTRRAQARLAELRENRASHVTTRGTLLRREGHKLEWWTWAGFRANATLIASLGALADPVQQPDDERIRLNAATTPQSWQATRTDLADHLVLPEVNPRAVQGLKFSAALPERLAARTVAARLADFDGARSVLDEAVRWETRQ